MSKCKHIKSAKRGGRSHQCRLEGKFAANKGLIWSRLTRPSKKKTAVLQKWSPPPVMKQLLANRKGRLESKEHLSLQSVATQVPGEPFMHSQHGSTRVHANSTQTVRWSFSKNWFQTTRQCFGPVKSMHLFYISAPSVLRIHSSQQWGYTLDKSLVRRRANTERETTSHSHTLNELPMSLICMSLHCVKKLLQLPPNTKTYSGLYVVSQPASWLHS